MMKLTSDPNVQCGKAMEDGPGGVALWSSRPPPEQRIPGSNPDRIEGFLKHRSSVVKT
jgi:hypothetical protein